jgi:DNA-directed RNA polymerase sigma subunit (sigma70/sigma32)
MNNAAVEFSIDKPIDDDSDMSYADTLESSTPPTDTIVQQESLCTDIQRWLMVLENDRARDIMEHSFGLNGTEVMTLEELAAKHQLSRERVRQIQQHALQTMRKHIPSFIF